MSQSVNQDPEKGNLTADNQLNQPPLSPSRQSQGEEINRVDGSGPLFTLYSKLAAEQDNKMAERWQKDAEGILIFTGLFSAVVTALAVVSIQDLRPNPQDTSSFYLEKIYQFQADHNVSHTSIPPVDVKPPPFSPPRYAIWVNLLWFLSLVISLTCAMLATLLQQWARRYIRITQLPRRSPDKRAQIRAFFANGVNRFHVAWAVEALPTLVHLSLFIFFAGLLIFLFNINPTVFSAVVCWVALSAAAYACITIVPIFCHDSPYYAPLSLAAWLLYSTIPYVLLSVLTFRPFHPHRTFWASDRLDRWTARANRYRSWILGGIEKAAEETTSKRSSEINSCIVEWTVDTLSEDDALEKFLEAIPGFYQSGVIEHLQEREVQEKIEVAAGKFLNRTLSSGTVSKQIIEHRLATCLHAADVVDPSGVAGILYTMLDGKWHGGPQAVEIGHFLMRWGKCKDMTVTTAVRCIIACIVKSVRERDDRWKALTLDFLNISERDLENYLAKGDSVLLANFISVIRQVFLSNGDWIPFKTLRSLSEFDIKNTLPELKHQFCLAWDSFVIDSQIRGSYSRTLAILNCIRPLFIASHDGIIAAPTNDSDNNPFKPSWDQFCWHHLIEIDPVPVASTSSTVPLTPDDDPAEVPTVITPSTGSDVSSLRSSTPDNTTPRVVDESSSGDAPSSITMSPSLVNPLADASFDPDITVTTQDADTQTAISSTSTLDPLSTPVAPTCTPQQTFPS